MDGGESGRWGRGDRTKQRSQSRRMETVAPHGRPKRNDHDQRHTRDSITTSLGPYIGPPVNGTWRLPSAAAFRVSLPFYGHLGGER